MENSDNHGESLALIVDDNPFNRELMKQCLRPEGYLVKEARNGKEALEYLNTSEFQLIFMDLLMPGMDGFETIQRIRNMGVTTPIIIVSAMSSKQDRQRCLEAGGDDFLPKPIDMDKIRKLLRQYRGIPFLKDNGKFHLKDESRAESIDFSNYHVLLVEEDENIASQYQTFLKNTGFNATWISNGNEAWDLFQASPYKINIIISNVFAPGIDGLGILARIKRDYSNILVFIYTKDYDTETSELAIRLGADGTITQGEFETDIIRLIESAIYQSNQKNSRAQAASTAIQVRKAQAQLIKVGCTGSCSSIDIGYSPLTDAGGDIGACRHFNLAGRCGIILGDVAGHSVISSYVSAFSLGILTSNWDKHQEPLELLKTINMELNKSDYDQFHLCATALLWDRCRKKIKLASAGIPGALLVRRNPDGILKFRELEGGGMCLGLLKEEGETFFLTQEIQLETGDYVFIFSDGIRTADLARLLLSGHIALDREDIQGLSQEIIDNILEQQGQDDDMILVVLKQQDNFRAKGLHYAFPSTYGEVDRACRWAGDCCIPDKIPKGRDPRLIICLALREALTNAVKHGNKFNSDAFVDLSLYHKPGELRMDISDEGAGFELPDKICKIEDINILQSGGRGISVMCSIANEINVSGGTVSLIFREKKRILK